LADTCGVRLGLGLGADVPSSKFATNACLHISPRREHVATLPCEYECQKNSDTLMKNINIINGYYIYTTNAAEIAHTSDSMWTCVVAVHGYSVCCRSEHAGPRVVDDHPVLIARVHCPVSSLPSTQLQPETQLQQVLQARNITHACDNDYRCRLLAFHLAETPRPCTA